LVYVQFPYPDAVVSEVVYNPLSGTFGNGGTKHIMLDERTVKVSDPTGTEQHDGNHRNWHALKYEGWDAVHPTASG